MPQSLLLPLASATCWPIVRSGRRCAQSICAIRSDSGFPRSAGMNCGAPAPGHFSSPRQTRRSPYDAGVRPSGSTHADVDPERRPAATTTNQVPAGSRSGRSYLAVYRTAPRAAGMNRQAGPPTRRRRTDVRRLQRASSLTEARLSSPNEAGAFGGKKTVGAKVIRELVSATPRRAPDRVERGPLRRRASARPRCQAHLAKQPPPTRSLPFDRPSGIRHSTTRTSSTGSPPSILTSRWHT